MAPQLAASRRAVYKACSARKFASTGMQWGSGPYGLALPGTALQGLLAPWSSPRLLHSRGRTLFARPIPHEGLYLLGTQVGPARDAYPKTPNTSQTTSWSSQSENFTNEYSPISPACSG